MTRMLDFVESIRGPWMATAEYGDFYYDRILSDLGDRQIIKVNMQSLTPNWWAEQQLPRLQNATVSEVPMETKMNSWRDLTVFWFHHGPDYRADICHRLAAVDEATAAAVGDEILALLGGAL
jgi:hypothetical protein